MKIIFRQWGPVLGTRMQGRKVRSTIERALQTSREVVVLDFSEVEVVSSSFADESLAKLAYSIGLDKFMKRTTFRNANAPVTAVIRRSLAERSRDMAVTH